MDANIIQICNITNLCYICFGVITSDLQERMVIPARNKIAVLDLNAFIFNASFWDWRETSLSLRAFPVQTVPEWTSSS